MMKKADFGYSIKNISIPPKETYFLRLMEKVEMVITKMRWKALCFHNNDMLFIITTRKKTSNGMD